MCRLSGSIGHRWKSWEKKYIELMVKFGIHQQLLWDNLWPAACLVRFWRRPQDYIKSRTCRWSWVSFLDQITNLESTRNPQNTIQQRQAVKGFTDWLNKTTFSFIWKYEIRWAQPDIHTVYGFVLVKGHYFLWRKDLLIFKHHWFNVWGVCIFFCIVQNGSIKAVEQAVFSLSGS